MSEPRWVLREFVLSLHERLLSEFGGASGVRDSDMFESALQRPVNRSQYVDSTIHELAAAYAYGLVRNHPFVDGNKRIGFAVATVFLQINGYHFQASEAEAVIKTLALAAGELDEGSYAQWLKTSSEPI